MSKNYYEATEQDLNEFFLKDQEGDYLKYNNQENNYDILPGIEDAQIFSAYEAEELISENNGLQLFMERVGDVLDKEKYNIYTESI